MKIPINLASEPFRRDRPLIVASMIVAGLLCVTLIVLGSLVLQERQRSAEDREIVAKLSSDLLAVSAEQSKLEGTLRQPGNAEVIDKIAFTNLLLQRKGMSWTKLFADLEKVMPHDVRLMSVRPQINGRNELLLDMTVGATSSAPVIQMMSQMEGSSTFDTVTPHSFLPPSQAEPLFRYRVSVRYVQAF